MKEPGFKKVRNTMGRVLLTLVAVPLLYGQTPQLYAGPQRDVWVAFRYDSDRVIFYTEHLSDLEDQKVQKALPPPVVRYGSGGYLLPLTPERLATLQPNPGPQGGGERVKLDQKYTLWLDGKNTIEATTEEYVEQWSSEIRVAVIARVAGKFKGDYFLISRERRPFPPAAADVPPLRASRKIVGRFGVLGNLAIDVREAGWFVSLLTPSGQRTNVEYHYGD